MTQEEMKINHDKMIEYENHMIERMAEAKLESKIMTALIDTILDNSKLTYDGEGLRIESDSEMFAIIKAFFSVDYEYRLTELKDERDAERQKAKELAESIQKSNGGKKNG